jgi:hypothetical protein
MLTALAIETLQQQLTEFADGKVTQILLRRLSVT